MKGLGEHRPLLILFGVFAACSLLVVPTLTPVAIADDFVYARVVKTLVEDHRLVLGDLPAAIFVGQAAWGAVFAGIFGFSFGILRVSTLVVTGLGALGLFGLCRELGVDRRRSTIGTALYLFNPLAYVLAHTFMTDGHFVAWLLLSTWAYVGGVRRDEGRWIVLGSLFAAMAILIRQQGVAIPVTVAATVLLHRRTLDRGVVARVLQAALLPFVAYVGYYLLVSYGPGVPLIQQHFIDMARGAPHAVLYGLLWRVPYIQLVLVGLGLVPLCLAVMRRPDPNAVVDREAFPRLAVLGAFGVFVALACVTFIHERRLVPIAATFITQQGLGPNDLRGGRPDVVGETVRVWMTIAATVLGFAVVAVTLAGLARRRARRPARAERRPAPVVGMVVALLVGQLIGSLPPSVPFTLTITLDRYLLPVLALSIPLFLLATMDIRLRSGVAWACIAAIGAFSVVSTRDYLVYEHAIWSTAGALHDGGVPLHKIDAGPAWDGWHLSDGTLYERRTKTPDPVGWILLFAPATDSTYMVTNPFPHPDSTVIRTVPYSSWLQRRRTVLEVRKRRDADREPTAGRP